MRRKSVVSLVIFLALLCFASWKFHNFQLSMRLWNAARSGDVTAARDLLRRGASPDSSWQGLSALRSATFFGHTEIAQMLLNAGASTKDVMRTAAARGRPDIIKLMLTRGEPANNEGGYAALYMAASEGDTPLVKSLLSRGANPNLRRNVNNRSLLQVVQARKNKEIIRLLKAAGAH